jgi:hypothetical protein
MLGAVDAVHSEDRADTDGILVGVVMDSRAYIVADAVGSVRAEGLEPGPAVIEILDRWVDRTIDTEQLGEAACCLAAGESVAHLVGQPEPASTQR